MNITDWGVTSYAEIYSRFAAIGTGFHFIISVKVRVKLF